MEKENLPPDKIIAMLIQAPVETRQSPQKLLLRQWGVSAKAFRFFQCLSDLQ